MVTTARPWWGFPYKVSGSISVDLEEKYGLVLGRERKKAWSAAAVSLCNEVADY